MIHRLEIENFYSICETQIIDLRIGAKVPDEELRFARIEDSSGDRVPKTIAIYGHNASGKSNVLRALQFVAWFLSDSFKLEPTEDLPVSRFADGNTNPIRVKVDFDWFASLNQNHKEAASERALARYTYEVKFFALSGGPLSVLSEELRQLPIRGKSRRIFLRSENGDVQTSTDYPVKGLTQALAKLRGNVSLTSSVAQIAEHPATKAILDWANNITTNIFNISTNPFERNPGIAEQDLFRFYKGHPFLVNDMNQLLGRVDIGIRSMSFADTVLGPEPQFQHSGLDKPLLFLFESKGTRQFFSIYPHIWEALHYGGIAVIDELDSTIHPMLLPEILRWFHDPVENPHNAQLWFSGHSASLLEELQKEEIFFTEKDQQGRTSVYGLKDIESVRRSDNFYQKYLGGVYGAVPRIG